MWLRCKCQIGLQFPTIVKENIFFFEKQISEKIYFTQRKFSWIKYSMLLKIRKYMYYITAFFETIRIFF